MFIKRKSLSHRKEYPKIVNNSPKVLISRNNGYVNVNTKNRLNKKPANLTQLNSNNLLLTNGIETQRTFNCCLIQKTFFNNEIYSTIEPNSKSLTRNNQTFLSQTTNSTFTENDSKSTNPHIMTSSNFISPLSINKRRSKVNYYNKPPISFSKNNIPNNSQFPSTQNQKLDINALNIINDKLNNVTLTKTEEKKRHSSYDKWILQIATNKLQNVIEKNIKRRNDSLSNTSSHSKTKKHKKKRIKSANKYYSILNQQNTLDKINRIESIILSTKTKRSSNSIITHSQFSKIYEIDYIMSIKQFHISTTTSNLPQSLINHFAKYKIYEDIFNSNNKKSKDFSNEYKQAEEFKLKLESKHQQDPIKFNLTELLNMLTVDNYKNIYALIFKAISSNIDYQVKFLEVLFQKAISEKAFVPLYANLCKDLDKDLPQRTKQAKNKSVSTSVMRIKLVDKCKEIFSIENSVQIEEYIKAKDQDEKEFKTKNFVLGNVNFICELISIRLLTKKIWFHCIYDLFRKYENKKTDNKLKMIDLEAIIIFTDKFGTLVNNQKSKITKSDYKEFVSQINDTLMKLEYIQKNDKIPGHVKYKIINLIEKKKSGWEETKFEKHLIAKGKEDIRKGFEEFLIN